jgi:hypothetical protein
MDRVRSVPLGPASALPPPASPAAAAPLPLPSVPLPPPPLLPAAAAASTAAAAASAAIADADAGSAAAASSSSPPPPGALSRGAGLPPSCGAGGREGAFNCAALVLRSCAGTLQQPPGGPPSTPPPCRGAPRPRTALLSRRPGGPSPVREPWRLRWPRSSREEPGWMT